jgi:malonyl-CoA O-methyltransferase
MADDPHAPPATGMRHLSTRDGYNLWSASYDDGGNPMVALDDRVLTPLIWEVAGHRVLDLGCGTGRHAIRMAAAGAEVTGIDASPGMLRQARARTGHLGVTFVQGDLTATLPFRDGVFSLAVSSLVLEHLPNLGHFFHEAYRIAQPDARLAVSAMHP